jgi:hypothetical protein
VASAMSSRGKKTHFDDGNTVSKSSRTTPPLEELTYPRNGNTRIPKQLVSKAALINLGYPFTEEGDTITVQVALGKENIDELLRLSKEYKRFRKGDSDEQGIEGDTSIPSFDWVNVEAEEPELSPPTSTKSEESDESDEEDPQSVFSYTEPPSLSGQVVFSGVLSLKSTRDFREGDSTFGESSGILRAWHEERSVLINGTITELFSIHAAEYYMDRSGQQKVTLVCPTPSIVGDGDPSLVRMRWL